MRIVVDALGISRRGGGRTATLVWLEGLLRNDRSNNYVVFLDQPEPELESLSQNARFVYLGIADRFISRLALQGVMPFYAAQADIVHYSKNLVCVTPRPKTVVTIYDLSAVTLPSLYPLSDRLFWRIAQPLVLRLVSRIVAISQFTAREIVRAYGINPAKIQVIYPACAKRYVPVSPDGIASVLKKHAILGRYVLHVGALSRKKNVSTLIRAFANVVARGYTGSLLLVGSTYLKLMQESLLDLAQQLGLAERVIALGEVPDADMPAIYSGADALAMPSLCEGFGLVTLEAISCGAPVIASGDSGMAEVVGSAGLLLPDPTDHIALAGLLGRVLFEPTLASELRRAGFAQSRKFSSDIAAAQTISFYRSIAPTIDPMASPARD